MNLSALVAAAYVEVQRTTGRKPSLTSKLNRFRGRPVEPDFIALAHLRVPVGMVMVDAGAVGKLRAEGKSLLPIGVVAVEGEFSRGDVIAVRAPGGHEVARGLANYSAAETRLIARKPSAQIEATLGYSAEPELIHRDNLVLA